MSTTERSELLAATPTRRELFHYDFAEDVGRIVEVEDTAPLMRAAAILADRPPGRDFRHAAVIPHYILNRAFREGWFHDKAAWKRWANDPDNARFRTWQGRL